MALVFASPHPGSAPKAQGSRRGPCCTFQLYEPRPPWTYYLGTGAPKGPLRAYCLGTWGARVSCSCCCGFVVAWRMCEYTWGCCQWPTTSRMSYYESFWNGPVVNLLYYRTAHHLSIVLNIDDSSYMNSLVKGFGMCPRSSVTCPDAIVIPASCQIMQVCLRL